MPERPADLKPEYYRHIADLFARLDDAELRRGLEAWGYDLADASDRAVLESLVLEQPSRYLLGEFRLLEKPASLAGTFIGFEDGQGDEGVDYFIDRTAAEAIALGQRSAVLYRLGDNAPFLVPVERIRAAFRDSCSLDYKEGY